MKKISKILVAVAAFFIAITTLAPVSAAKDNQGVDLAKYQGYTALFGKPSDKFAISQIGGYASDYGLYEQATYNTQVASTIAQGKRAHTYIWWQDITDTNTADYVLNYFLPKVQTPKDSIVALDIEAGGQNTDVVMYAMNRIKAAGYTAVAYGYKGFMTQNLDLQRIANTYPLWLAEYPNYEVTQSPNYNYFPSFANIHLFQFTSTYVSGGLDGDVDLTGLTDNGYTKHDNPVSSTPAIDAGQEADNTPKSDIEAGFMVKVNFSAKTWATGESIPSWVKGQSYTVKQVSGNNVLLDGIMSWINRKNVEILVTNSGVSNNDGSLTYTVQLGDTLSGIASAYGMTTAELASQNGISNWNYIWVGETLQVNGSGVSKNHTYTVQTGDNLYSIANYLGVSYASLASQVSNPNLIYPGQVLIY